MPQTKKCNKCRKTKEISDFNVDKSQKDGLGWCCKSCRISPRRKCDIYRKYSLSPRQYEKLFEKHKGCCAICGRCQSELKRTLCIDHDHKTREIRGLLCPACNRGVGYFQDSSELLNKAIQYLRKEIP